MPKQVHSVSKDKTVQEVIDSLGLPFHVPFTVTFDSLTVTPRWQPIYDHELNRAIVCDDPASIPMLGYQPVYWVATPQVTSRVTRFYGRANAPIRHRRGTGFSTAICIPIATQIQTAMSERGYRGVKVKFGHAHGRLSTQFESTEASAAAWGLGGMTIELALLRSANKTTLSDRFEEIPSDTPKEGLDLLFE